MNIIIIEIYFDNCLAIGKQESILQLIDELKVHDFKLKIEEELVDYLRSHIVESEVKNKL